MYLKSSLPLKSAVMSDKTSNMVVTTYTFVCYFLPALSPGFYRL